MPDLIENYVPQIANNQKRRQAIRAWSVFALLTALWLFLILLAPVAEAHNFTGISRPIYNLFGFLCHQMPERSLQIENHSLAVCSRCFGVYCGLLSGFIIYPFFRSLEEIEPLPRFWLFLALIPMIADWSLGVFDIWENTHISRFLTGLILGMACAVFIIPALIEIFQSLSDKRQIKRLSR